jgi:hypothetical protein
VEIDNNQIMQQIRNEVFLPALRKAAGEARKLDGSPNDMLSGSMMAFGDMLLTLTGKQGAILLLRGFADFLENVVAD